MDNQQINFVNVLENLKTKDQVPVKYKILHYK